MCAVCHSAWPCESARKLLDEAYTNDREGLAALMSWCMTLAAEERGVANPVEMYGRFVRWAFAREHRCRVCGKPWHDVLPSLPLRLTPCGAVREEGPA